MEENELDILGDADLIREAVKKMELNKLVAESDYFKLTGKNFPEWRNGILPLNNEYSNIKGAEFNSHNSGILFYPCSGLDIDAPIQAFGNYVSEFHFSDPFNPCIKSGKFRIKLRMMDSVEIPFIGTVVNHIGCSTRKNISGNWVICHQKDGLKTLLEDLPFFSIFYYRGDSTGEGGSNQLWLNPVLIDIVLSKIMNGGLICSDGSNGYGYVYESLRGLPVGSKFIYKNLQLTRLNFNLLGGRSPIFVWKILEI
jgi:hypothetical protein